MVESFLVTFHFEDDNPGIDEALQIIKGNIFAEVPFSPYSMPSWVPIAEGALQCYHVDGNQEDEDPRDINIPETEGDRGVEGPTLETKDFAQPLNTRKVNIGSESEPKFANIGTIGMKKQ
jgi:hypothetical protein